MSTTPVFSGTSTFSSSFSQVIDRATSIASLPIGLLNTKKSTLSAEQSALTSLSNSFSSLQATLYSLGSAVGSGTNNVSYSDPTVASAFAGAGALPGTYNIEVVDPGSQASATSLPGLNVADPTTASISSASAFTLTANGQVFSNIMPPPGANTLTSLVTAINVATQGAVQATIVNVGTSAAPSYQLSIQNTSYGSAADLPITLTGDGGANLLGTPSTATAVQYRINGQPASPAVLSSDSRSLTLSPNLTATVLAAGTTSITLSQSTTNIANALSGFVTAYNAANQALDGQRGSSGGALAGDSIIGTLTQSLHDISNYTGTGSIKSISEIGLTFDSTGVLSFDPTVLSAAASANFQGVTDFLGNPATGGFLKAAADTLSSLTDSTTGVLPMVIQSTVGEITDTSNQISQNQDRVNLLKQNLSAQMAAADAMIASLQQQATYMASLFSAMVANQKSSQ